MKKIKRKELKRKKRFIKGERNYNEKLGKKM